MYMEWDKKICTMNACKTPTYFSVAFVFVATTTCFCLRRYTHKKVNVQISCVRAGTLESVSLSVFKLPFKELG